MDFDYPTISYWIILQEVIISETRHEILYLYIEVYCCRNKLIIKTAIETCISLDDFLPLLFFFRFKLIFIGFFFVFLFHFLPDFLPFFFFLYRSSQNILSSLQKLNLAGLTHFQMTVPLCCMPVWILEILSQFKILLLQSNSFTIST